MSRWMKLTVVLLCLTAFAIPIEYEYNKLFRHFSKALIPEGLFLPQGFPKLLYFYRSDLAAILLFFIAIFGLRVPLRRFFFEKGAPFFWAIFLFALLSIVASPLAHYPVAYARLLQLFTPLLLFSLCANGFSPENRPKIAQWLFLSIVLAALFQSICAIAQYFLQSPLGLSFLGEPQHSTGTYEMPNGKIWLFSSASQLAIIMRAQGTFLHPNVLGGFLALSLLASYSLILGLKRPFIKILLALSLPLQFFAMSVTFSRAALFAWILGTLVWFALILYRRQFRVPLFRLLASMIVLSPLLAASLLSEQYFHRGGVVNYNIHTWNADSGRLEFQRCGMQLILKKPFLGNGYYQYDLFAERHQLNTGMPHNIYLVLAVETGLISLAAFLFFIALVLYAALRAPPTPQVLSLLAIFIAFLFIGCCDFYPLRLQQGKLMFFITSGLLAGLSFQERRSNAYALS